MALTTKRRKLISFDQAAEIPGISASTIRKRNAGTAKLTHVCRPGAAGILLIEDELLDLQRRWIREEARTDAIIKRLLRGSVD